MNDLNKGSRKIDQIARAPGRQARSLKGQARRAVNAPLKEARGMKQRAQRLARMPGQQARRTKNQFLRPFQSVGRSLGMAGAGVPGAAAMSRRYKRKADRMASTDFTVSAMLYPFGMILGWFAGMVADWDTAYIRYHLVHARILAFIAFWFIPISVVLVLVNPIIALVPIVLLFLFWAYAWYLGFRAYGGNFVVIPFITNYAESRGKIDFDTLEKAFSQ